MRLIAANRKISRNINVKRYISTCKYHGDCIRYVSNGTCVECTLERAEKWRKNPENKGKLRTARSDWDRVNPEKAMLQRCRARARASLMDFNLDITDIAIPTVCPVLGVELKRSTTKQDSSPSIDRFDSSKGYVKGNVRVISFRANRLKSDATVDEIKAVLSYMEGEL